MLVLSKRNIDIPAPDGSAVVHLRRDGLESVPDWVAELPYFRELVADGKVVVTGKADRETQAAAEKKTRVRRGKETTEE